ncbi:formyltransferase family protein, partial [Acinetobacter variabilis]
MIKIAVLVSGSGSNLQALIDANLSGEIVGVLSNKPEAFALERAHKAGIPTAVIE